MKVLFYDGECGACDAFVRFVLKYEHGNTINFCQIQSRKGRQILFDLGVLNVDMTTAYFWDGEECFARSRAIFRIFRELRQPFRMMSVLGFFPQSWTDPIYVFISSKRQLISSLVFRKTSCELLPENVTCRFLS